MHLPVNHRLSGFYRFLAALAGLFVLVFGIVGAIRSAGEPAFGHIDVTALGLHTNLAFSVLSIVVGAIVVVGAVIGGNVAHYVNQYGGGVFWLAGLAMLLLLHTDANFLNFRVSTCIVSFLLGTFLVLAGLYGRRGSAEDEQAEDRFRHSGRGTAATGVTTHEEEVSAHPNVVHGEHKE
jgi:Domain of unknown function (DUF4383)